jgi:hypothetical protein
VKLTPEYAKNIIVAIIHNNETSWYVTDKEIWYMDYEKRIKQFKDKGYDINMDYIDDLRKGILMLDVNTIKTFEKRLDEFKVSTDELKHFLVKEKNENEEWHYDWSPSLYIDFDKKVLCSAYREMANYESFVPEGWQGKDKEFLEDIPLQERYWLDETNRSYFE